MSLNRRQFGLGLGAGLLSSRLTAKSTNERPRVLVVGAGVGGLSFAQVLRQLLPPRRIELVILEPQKNYRLPVWAHRVLAGDAAPDEPASSYPRQIADQWITAGVEQLIPNRSQVQTTHGDWIHYDYLLLAPGLESEAGTAPPAGWFNGSDIQPLLQSLNGLRDGARIVMTVPHLPYRCPPAPYERASLVLDYLDRRGVKDIQLSLIDAKEQFSQQAQFLSHWERRWPGQVEWLPPSIHEGVQHISANSVQTGFDEFRGDLILELSRQYAPAFCREAGIADFTGFCPVGLPNCRSTLAENVYIVGDAAKAADMPKSASAAMSQARHAAADLIRRLGHRSPHPPTGLNSTCFSRLDSQRAISSQTRYDEMGARLHEDISPFPLDETKAAAEYAAAESWYQDCLKGMGLSRS